MNATRAETTRPDKIGAAMRQTRLDRGVKAVFVAKKMGISATHLGDLERDNRNWSDAQIQGYEAALGLPAETDK